MKIKHYGHELSAEIKAKGYRKKRIAEMLHISFPTLKKRLDDGNFTREQLLILKSQYIL